VALFLVYEIDTESEPPGGSAETELKPVFTSASLGAYFADDEKEACVMAAEWRGKPGVLGACRAEAYKLALGSEPGKYSDEEAKKAKKKLVDARHKASA
jgi:hypothetical protein